MLRKKDRTQIIKTNDSVPIPILTDFPTGREIEKAHLIAEIIRIIIMTGTRTVIFCWMMRKAFDFFGIQAKTLPQLCRILFSYVR